MGLFICSRQSNASFSMNSWYLVPLEAWSKLGVHGAREELYVIFALVFRVAFCWSLLVVGFGCYFLVVFRFEALFGSICSGFGDFVLFIMISHKRPTNILKCALTTPLKDPPSKQRCFFPRLAWQHRLIETILPEEEIIWAKLVFGLCDICIFLGRGRRTDVVVSSKSSNERKDGFGIKKRLYRA